MGFKAFPQQEQVVQLLQRSLERGRLAHAYLFVGHQLEELEALARTLAKTLNCQHPARHGGVAVDSCDACLSCQRIDHGNHPDVHWVRPESKTRIIAIDQVRELTREIQLKPTEAEYKVAVMVAADRLKSEAANAFLKTLEEPPPRSILILLATDPQRLLETIISRCLRLNFAGDALRQIEPSQAAWIAQFSEMAAGAQKSLLGRYRVLDVLLQELNRIKTGIEESLAARSPLQQYPDAEKETVERWEDELSAAIEAEYRRQRSDLLGLLQWWLRDVWLHTLAATSAGSEPAAPGNGVTELLSFPDLAGAGTVAGRVTAAEAEENLQILEQLQRRLGTNVQEALALEVSLLKLKL